MLYMRLLCMQLIRGYTCTKDFCTVFKYDVQTAAKMVSTINYPQTSKKLYRTARAIMKNYEVNPFRYIELLPFLPVICCPQAWNTTGSCSDYLVFSEIGVIPLLLHIRASFTTLDCTQPLRVVHSDDQPA